jgi:hypothetical protein
MANATTEHPPTMIEDVEATSHPTCPICRDFGSEECDVLQNLGRYRATEESIRKAIETTDEVADGAKASPTV